MTDSTHATLLRRMTRSQDAGVVENPLTSSRAVRLALTKSANDTVGLSLSVTSVAEEVRPLDDMLDALPAGLMLMRLERQGQLTGLIALDMQLRAAVLEMETMGTLSAQIAEDRAPTRTDKTLCDPMVAAFLRAFPEAVRGTSVDGWGGGVTHQDRITDTRAAGLMLDDREYRVVQMNVQLGPEDRQGILLMALPLVDVPETVDAPIASKPDWDSHFPDLVAESAATLTALLHRFKTPLAAAQAMQVGTIVPLTGCNVNSVKMVALDGQVVAQAKLGQSGGMRAVRLQAPPSPDLYDLPHRAAPAIPTLAADDPHDVMAEVELAVPTGIDALGLPEEEMDFAAEALE